MKSTAIYARVSSEAQAKQATVESQVAALKQRAAADGHIVLAHDVYVDEGFSGATLRRPALEKLRDKVAEGAVELLYVHSPDRLARRYAYQVLLLEEFRLAGVEVIFLLGSSQHNAEDELLVQVQGMIAEYERAKILERCRRGKLHRARQGLVNPLSGAPYGYLYIKKSDEAPARYEVLLHEAKVVRFIFDALVHQQKSIGDITRTLNAQQTPTRRGAARWDRATVWALLKNPAYMGKAAFGKTEATERRQLLRPIRGKAPIPRRAKGAHRDKPKEDWTYVDVPALVSAETFEAAQQQLERNQRLSQRNARGQRYLLQGLTVCAKCGYSFYGKAVSKAAAKGKPSYSYYRCVGADAYRFAGGRVCHNPQVRTEVLDDYVWQSLCELLENPQRLEQEWTRRQSADGVPHDLQQQRDQAQRVLIAQEKTLQRLVDAYEAGALELSELKTRSTRVRERLDKARLEVATAQQKLSQVIELTAVMTRLEEFASRVRAGLHRLSWVERRQLIRTLVAKVVLDEEAATIVYRLPATPPAPVGPPDSTEGTQEHGSATPNVGSHAHAFSSLHLREGRHRRPLRRSLAALCPPPLFHHSCTQPFLDESQNPLVRDPVRDELHQPPVVDGIEESTDIRVEHPVHLLAEGACCERIQRIVLAPPRAEPVGEAKEVFFVDGVEHLDDGSLDEFVFQRGNAERPLPSVRLRDVRPTRWLRTVRSLVQSLMQVSKLLFEPGLVLLPRHSVHPGRCFLLQTEERFPEPIDGDVVEERGEPHTPIPPCCLTYTVQRTRRACPALCPGRVLLVHVPLSQSPSLHHLRCRCSGIVRRLRRYYGSVRLPLSVHHRGTTSGLPDTACGATRRQTEDLPVLARGVSAHARGLRPRRAAPELAVALVGVVLSGRLTTSAPWIG